MQKSTQLRVRLCALHSDAIQLLAETNRRTITAEVALAIDAHMAANRKLILEGGKLPKGKGRK